MKKVINMAFIYAILALVGGLYYRELTKINEFTGNTQLSIVHTHLFSIGMMMMLIVYLFSEKMNLHSNKKFNTFFIIYNIGVFVTSIMMTIRGTLQVISFNITDGLDSAMAGISGIGHILLAIGFVMFLLMLRNSNVVTINRTKNNV